MRTILFGLGISFLGGGLSAANVSKGFYASAVSTALFSILFMMACIGFAVVGAIQDKK